jgi:hypothetical protein
VTSLGPLPPRPSKPRRLNAQPLALLLPAQAGSNGLWHCPTCCVGVAGAEVIWQYHASACLVQRSTGLGAQLEGHSAVVEVRVGLEPGAVAALTGTTPDAWRTLSAAERRRRVPALAAHRDSAGGHGVQAVQMVPADACPGEWDLSLSVDE